MNRFLVLGLVGISGAVTAGCPIYSHDSSECSDSDCPWGMVCSGYGYCVTPSQAGGSAFVPAGQRGGAAGKGGGSIVPGRGGSTRIDAGPAGSAGVSGASDAGLVSGEGGASTEGGAAGKGGVSAKGGAGGAAGGSVVPAEAGVGGSEVVADSGSDAASDVYAPSHEDGSSADGAAVSVYCGHPNDCAAGQTCTAEGICAEGDCANHACINQFVCSQVDGGLACTLADPAACSADGECANGNKCIDGRCTPQADLCSDQTQCVGGSVCVEGKCVTSCGSDLQCPSGYKCRTQPGICDIPSKGCNKTSDCGDADSVCVQNACVSRCAALGSCDEGAGVCVSNGCIPAQNPVRECDTDGDSAGCGAGRICLHHHCYVSCEAPNESACAGLFKFTMCKTVATSSGTHAVCGSAQNLGSECDPTRGVACDAGQCIDGFCR